jgi:hypothetical protein
MQINKKAIKHYFVLIMLWMLLAVSPAYCINTYYVDPNGSDGSTTGDINHPYKTINKGVTVAVAGDTVYVRAGTYTYSGSALTLSAKSGSSASNRPKLFAYQNERPLVDLSAMGSGGTNGIKINGNYWYVKGIDFKGAPNNGIAISGGSYNIIEFCRAYESRDSGVQLSNGASYNQIINCDSYYNYDATSSPPGTNADGFATKLTVGTGNSYYGCRSWQNSDDGYDGYLRPSNDITTTFENCWAFKNGYLKDGSVCSGGNGNGFKMGGSTNKDLKHNVILKKCLAFSNSHKGFDQNNNKGSMTLYNCTGFSNVGNNYNIPSELAIGKTCTIINCVSHTGGIDLGGFILEITDSWQSPFVVTDADFNSIDPSAAYGARNADGSLPDITFMHLVVGSDLIDAGYDVGLPWCGSAPDLGCFEYNTGIYPGAASSPTPTNSATGVSNTQDLSWTAGSDTTSHDVYFGTDYPLIGNQTGTTYDTGTMVQAIAYYWRIYEKNADCTTPGPLWSFTTAPPPPPGQATNPTPTNSATGVSNTQDLSWTAGSGIVDSHSVYFGTVNPPPHDVNQTATTYDTGTMVQGITYYWRIDENNLGGITTGTVWHFTTAPPPPPGAATNPTPANSAINVSQTQDLIWTAGSGIVDSHDVYFGTAASPPLVSSNQTATSYDTGTMIMGTTYYWRIDENNLGGTTTGTVWSFTTTSQQNVLIIGSWITGLTHAKETGTNRGLIFIAHGKHTSADPNLTAVSYGGQSMTRIIAKLQPAATNRPYVAAFYLNEAGIAAATTTTFTPTWTNEPPYLEYRSAFVENVNQTTSIGAIDSNATDLGTGPTIGTHALATAPGDLVIESSANTGSGTNGTFTANNGFTKDFDSIHPSYDAMDGHKTTTAASETPYVTHTLNSSRKVLIGFVVKDAASPPPEAASNPSPSDGATDVNLTQNLIWSPGAGTTLHGVYFGTVNPPPFEVNQTATNYATGTRTSLTTYYWRIKEINPNGTNLGPVWSFTTWDTVPPTPNPMTWASEPNAISNSSISMTANTASDLSGVQYYFANITDSNHDSNWVASPVWTDTGLVNNTKYNYKVKARDMSTNHNQTGWSTDANATTLIYVCNGTIVSDLTGNCQVDLFDFVQLADAWANNSNPPDVDLNGDGVLDLKDLAQFALDWLTCNRDPAGECWK